MIYIVIMYICVYIYISLLSSLSQDITRSISFPKNLIIANACVKIVSTNGTMTKIEDQ